MCENTLSEDEVRTEYEACIQELDYWGCFVDRILNDYVSGCFKSKEHLQMRASHRVKDINSYLQKVLYRYQTNDPIHETTDKVGTRVVLLTRDDVGKVASFIQNSNHWVFVRKTRDSHKDIIKNPEAFTYQSEHFIVQPNDAYTTQVEKSILTCEIQLRTILQHAYAEISHDTIYKKPLFDNPSVVRKLASSMAFIEAADEKFIQIYQSMESNNYFQEIFQNQLISLYESVTEQYDKEEYSVETANLLLGIYSSDDLQQMSDNLDSFVKEPDNDIRGAIQEYKEHCLLFQHPIILVALYGIMNFQTTTKTRWPFSYESLTKVIAAMDISIDAVL